MALFYRSNIKNRQMPRKLISFFGKPHALSLLCNRLVFSLFVCIVISSASICWSGSSLYLLRQRQKIELKPDCIWSSISFETVPTFRFLDKGNRAEFSARIVPAQLAVGISLFSMPTLWVWSMSRACPEEGSLQCSPLIRQHNLQ